MKNLFRTELSINSTARAVHRNETQQIFMNHGLDQSNVLHPSTVVKQNDRDSIALSTYKVYVKEQPTTTSFVVIQRLRISQSNLRNHQNFPIERVRREFYMLSSAAYGLWWLPVLSV
jgi:hypothetical protein